MTYSQKLVHSLCYNIMMVIMDSECISKDMEGDVMWTDLM